MHDLVAFVVLALGRLAHAGGAAVPELGERAGVSAAVVDVRVDGPRTHVVLELTATDGDTGQERRDRSVVLRVPHGVVVTGLTATIAGRTTATVSTDARVAQERYREALRYRRDPALLEHVATTPAFDVLRVHVFPLTTPEPAAIELELTRAPAGAAVDALHSLVTTDILWNDLPCLSRCSPELTLEMVLYVDGPC